MDESNSKKENPNGGQRRFSQEQYDMLLRCSEKKDMTEWNEWRRKKPGEEILLEGEKALFDNWYLQNANFRKAQLRKAQFWGSDLQKADFTDAHLEGASFREAKLKFAKFVRSHLEDVELLSSYLLETNLSHVHLEGAKLENSHLESACLWGAHLEDASLVGTIVNSSTTFWMCKISRKTDFRGVAIDTARIYPGTKQLLEYNIRRMNWEECYKKHPKLKYLVKPFWLMSDYGLSTGRIIVTFFALAFIFANIYYHWGRIALPGIVEYLFVDRNGIVVPSWLVPLRTLYFSIVTMTTLGFGDMYANAQSIWGHILLSLQVILGYVLLGALVTRFAVLFTAGGPAGRFADEKKKKDKTCQEQ